MSKQTIATQEALFQVLDLMDKTGIRYWLDGGWGVDVLVGEQTRPHRDVDINFDAEYTEALVQTLEEAGYKIETDWRSVRIELHHEQWSYIDIHPFMIAEDGKARQADLEGGFYEFDADFFDEVVFQGRKIPCISLKGQRIFHTGYELRGVDKHDIANLEKLENEQNN